jgi:uncharacterized protein YutE (UPF0331/DUF86 family)
MTHSHRKDNILRLLAPQYERRGFSVFLYPSDDLLPSFLKGLKIDAIAVSSGHSEVIAVKTREALPAGHLDALARKFIGQTDWQLQIIYAEEFPEASAEMSIPVPDDVALQISEVEALATAGHHTAALLLTWAALEAAARIVDTHRFARLPKAPRETLEVLERFGGLSADQAQRLRGLVHLRNAVAHGDTSSRVDKSDVIELLSVAKSVLAELRTAA